MSLNGEPGPPCEFPCDSLRLLERRLGVESGRIATLRGQCEIFADICADYEECCARLRVLEQESQDAGVRVRQYAEMREQLQRDIVCCLEGAPPCRCRETRSRKSPESGRFPS